MNNAKVRIVPKELQQGDYRLIAKLDECGVQKVGLMFYNPNTPYPVTAKFTDAQVNYVIAKLELEKEETVAFLDKIINQLKSTLDSQPSVK